MRKLLTLFAAIACVGHAQITNSERRAKLAGEIRDLLDRAPAAPPELEADILLRLVEAGKIADKELGVEIIEEAFARAGSARFPTPLVAATDQGRSTDSDVGVRRAALNLHLDTLSLRCRAIQAMVRLNRKRALELFESLSLHIPARTCSDAMVDRVDEFYPTLALVVTRGFSQAEQQENKHLAFAESHIRSMVAPAQLEPAAKMLIDLHLDRKQLQPMLAAYNSALHEMSADDRAFSSATHQGLLDSLARLANDSQAKGVSSFELAAAFRTYYVRHMRGSRCEDDTDSKEARTRIAHTAELFNSELLPLADPEGKQIHD